MSLKIVVYGMAKNEADNVNQFARCVEGADQVVITDTGSDDGTPDQLRDHGLDVYTARVMPWRFDVATNVALANVPADADVCVKLDLDEVLHTTDGSHWRAEIEQLWQPGVNRIRYWYTWNWHVPGKIPAVRFRTAHIHGRSHFVWRHAGHAALTHTDRRQGRTAEAQRLEIHHYMQAKDRPNYLPLLQLAVHECKSPRTLFYLGREYHYRRMNDNCISTLEEYLGHRGSTWRAERADALRMIGVSYRRLGDQHSALSYLMRSVAEFPGVRDLWFEVLRHFHEVGDFEGGYWAAQKVLAIDQRNPELCVSDGAAWFDMPLLLAAACAWNCGREQEARPWLEQGLQLNPSSELGRALASTMGIATP